MNSPADLLTTTDDTPTFNWNRITGGNAATSYKIQIDNSGSGFPSPEVDQSVPQPGSGTVSFTAPSLALGTYSWRVQGINLDGSGPFSTRTFTIALVAPVLVSPTAGSTTTDQTPQFTWNRVTGAGSYQIQVDDSNAGTTNCDSSTHAGTGFNSPTLFDVTVSDPGSGTTVSFTPVTDLAENDYFWHVRSISSSGVLGCYSAFINFDVDDTVAPPAPTLVTPADGTFTNDQTPLFDWNEVTDPSGINRYVLQYSTSSTFATGTVTQNVNGNPPASDFTPTAGNSLLPNIWYWRVSARDSSGLTGPVSSVNSFTIDITAPTTAPTLVAPANGAAINDNTPTFDWNDVIDSGTPSTPIKYELLVDTDSSFPSPDISQLSLTSSTFTPGAGSELSPDGIYFWKVRAKDSAGNLSPFSSIFSFNLDTTGPAVTASPTSGTFAVDQSVTLSSTAPDLASIYYTTDGSTPDDTDTLYSGPISITATAGSTTTTTLKFIGYDAVGNPGTVVTETYIIDKQGPTVTASPTGGTFAVDQSVTLSSTDADLDTIYYTTDGTEPDNTSTEYTGAISITATAGSTTTTTLKFIGYDTLGNAGTVVTETYTIDSTGPTVTASPPGGTFGTSQSVTLSSTDADLDAIYYTTDGSTPDNTDTEYTGPISITTTTTLKFIGYDTLGNAGTVVTETYTIEIAPSSGTALTLRLSTNVNVPSASIPSSLQNLLDSVANIPITGGSTYTASGKLIDSDTNLPLSGKTITITTDGSSPVTATTNNNGVFTIQLTAPNNAGLHNIQAHFAGDSQYKSSKSPIKKIFVTGNNLALTGTNLDTTLNLKLDGNEEINPDSTYSAFGKLVDSLSKKPIAGKTITITTDGESKVTDTTDKNGEFEINLKAPDSPGKYDVQAHFAGDSKYKPSDSAEGITVKDANPQTEEENVAEDEEQPEGDTEDQTDEETDDTEDQTDEETDDTEDQTDEETNDTEEEEETE